MSADIRLCNCSELNLTIALIFHSPFSIFNYCNKKGTLFRGFLFMQLWFVKRRNYSSTLTYTPPLRQDSVAALAMRTGRRPSIAPTAVWVSLLIASTKEITWLMNATRSRFFYVLIQTSFQMNAQRLIHTYDPGRRQPDPSSDSRRRCR